MAVDIENLGMADLHGCVHWVLEETHLMFGSLQTAVVAIMLGIDVFYRIEWFELNSPLQEILRPLFGGH